MMIHCAQGGFARGGKVLVTDYAKEVFQDGKVQYSLDCVNQSDFVVVPVFDLAFSDT